MTRIIKWAEPPPDGTSPSFKPKTPFDKGQVVRPIRMTFHDASLKELPEPEKMAMDVLNEFAGEESPNLMILGTESGNLPFIEIDNQYKGDHIPVMVRFSEKHCLKSGIRSSNQLSHWAEYLVNRLGGTVSDHEQALQDLIVARAHHLVHQDILVTSSKWLLGNKEFGLIEDANPCLPSEAIKILGLLLRSRNDFRFEGKTSFDKGLFYWALMRFKLPAMWRYFSACVMSEKLRGDNIENLGESILVRCERAIQARDEIGSLFYLRQDNNTRDDALYHFDYMVLLLSGALDAQARVAYRAYQISTPKNEKNANFRETGFINAISDVDTNLAGFLRGDYFKDISKMVSLMRNTIHGAGLTTLALKKGIDPEKSYVRLPDGDQSVIWDICEKNGSSQRWGLVRFSTIIVFEPYEFSQRLLDHVLKIVNTIAALTQVEKLFPDSSQIPELKNCSPIDDHIFSANIGERLALLA